MDAAQIHDPYLARQLFSKVLHNYVAKMVDEADTRQEVYEMAREFSDAADNEQTAHENCYEGLGLIWSGLLESLREGTHISIAVRAMMKALPDYAAEYAYITKSPLMRHLREEDVKDMVAETAEGKAAYEKEVYKDLLALLDVQQEAYRIQSYIEGYTNEMGLDGSCNGLCCGRQGFIDGLRRELDSELRYLQEKGPDTSKVGPHDYSPL